MKFKCGPSAALIAGLTLLASHPRLEAQLPSLSEGDRLGFFATHKDRNVEFGITTLGVVRLMPKLSSGLSASFLGGTYTIDITPRLIATSPSGKTTVRRITDSSLNSPDAATDAFEQTTIRAEVTGGAKFEFSLQQNRGTLLMGGRLLNPQEMTTPHHFAIDIKVPAQLTSNKLDELSKLTRAAADDRAARRELRDMMRDFRSDRLSVRWIDGNDGRFAITESFDDGARAINGPGIAGIEIQSHIYQARRVVVTAEEGSAITLTPTREGMLQPGFTLTWRGDPAKDPEGKARVAIAVR